MILRCPKCKTIKSHVSQKSLNKDAHATRDTRQCEICNHIWERPYINIDTGIEAEVKSPTKFRIYSLFRKLTEHFVHQFGFELNGPQEE